MRQATQSAPARSDAPPGQPRRTVLIVEDETDIADLLSFNLQREGYECRTVASGEAALEQIRREPPDLLLLDRMIPAPSGDEIIARLKRDAATAAIPIVVLTAKTEESDQLVGFALGADDYVTKPFSMKLLLARVAAVMRRAERGDDETEVLSGGPVRLVPSHHQLTVNGDPVSVTATEFRLLRALMAARGRVLDRARLIAAVLGQGVAVTDRTIDVHITALRRKLGPGAAWVQTVRGVGYTFRQPAR